MSRIRSRNTSPEKAVRSALWKLGLRYTLRSSLLGKPDMVFTKARVVIFIDGCFWHCCPQHSNRPKGNGAFWARKLESNVKRDQHVNEQLRAAGWRVLRIWEHEIDEDLDRAIRPILQMLNKIT